MSRNKKIRYDSSFRNIERWNVFKNSENIMNKTCEKYLDWLAMDDLRPDQKSELDKHLEECSQCAALAAFLGNIESELAELPDTTPDLVNSVMKVVRHSAIVSSEVVLPQSLSLTTNAKSFGFSMWAFFGAGGLLSIIITVAAFLFAIFGDNQMIAEATATINLQTVFIAATITGSLLVGVAAYAYTLVVGDSS